jgi:hypothetical protein
VERAVQVVNGYICMNCCDVDKARLGHDPHQQTNQIQKQLKDLFDKSASDRHGPAVTFGGSLQMSANGNAATGGGLLPTSPAASGQGSPSASTCSPSGRVPSAIE